jgi:predicted nuclease of predicted toxin-antitoxin system
LKFKLDENLVIDDVSPLVVDGHDVETVADEQLEGSDDRRIFAASQSEGRCLVTMDLDFSNPLEFPPTAGAGIVVFRPGRISTVGVLWILAQQLAIIIPEHSPAGKLWIVEPGRIRVHQTDSNDG